MLTNEQKEIITEILPGFEATDETTLDDVKTAMGDRFIDVELHKKELESVWGKAKGTTNTAIKKTLRALGEEVEGKTLEDMLPLLEKRTTSMQKEIADLKAVGGDAVKVAELQKSYDDLRGILTEKEKEVAELNERLVKDVESARAEGETKLSQHLLDQSVSKEFEGANWTDDADEYVRNGVWTKHIDGKYAFKIENNETYVFDLQGGIVKDGTSQMTAKKLFEKIIKDAGKFKMNGAAAAPKGGNDRKPAASRPDEHRLKILAHIDKMKG